MLYRTTLDNVSIIVNTDIAPATLTIAENGDSVTITAQQFGVIKLLRRGLSDILDAPSVHGGKDGH